MATMNLSQEPGNKGHSQQPMPNENQQPEDRMSFAQSSKSNIVPSGSVTPQGPAASASQEPANPTPDRINTSGSQNLQAPASAPASQQPEYINIKIEDQTCRVFRMRIKRTESMQSVLQRFRKKPEARYSSTSILKMRVDGQAIGDLKKATAETLNLENGDKLEVFLEVDGGCGGG